MIFSWTKKGCFASNLSTTGIIFQIYCNILAPYFTFCGYEDPGFIGSKIQHPSNVMMPHIPRTCEGKVN